MTELGFVGTMLHGHTKGHFLDEPQFLPIFEAANALHAPVYLHPTPPTAAVMQAYFTGLDEEVERVLATAAWGWHAETGLHSLRLVASGLFDRCPELQFIIGHMGENIPFSLERAASTLGRVLHLERSVSEYFQENFWITTSAYFTVPPLLCALLVFGADRLIFSVDYPFADNVQGRRFLETAPISNADREKLAHGNVEGLLGL
jgi:hypothetical protein